ncbi:MAG: hypothetical protein ACR2KV_09875 [Solirubrobacteraceae bacterium]
MSGQAPPLPPGTAAAILARLFPRDYTAEIDAVMVAVDADPATVAAEWALVADPYDLVDREISALLAEAARSADLGERLSAAACREKAIRAASERA